MHVRMKVRVEKYVIVGAYVAESDLGELLESFESDEICVFWGI